MPAFASHYYFAKDVLATLDSDLQARIKEYRSFYDLGAQGPDIFFFYKPYKTNNISSYGTSLHNKPAKRCIEDAVIKIREYNDEAALVYLLGYVNHFTYDSSFHPYINKNYPDFIEHIKMETELDRFIINKYSRLEPHKFRRYLLINSRKKYASQLSLCYPTINKRILEEAVYQTSFYMKLTYSPYNIKTNMISFVCRSFKKTDFSKIAISKQVDSTYDGAIEYLMTTYDDTIALGKLNLENVVAYYDNKTKSLNDNFYKNFE